MLEILVAWFYSVVIYVVLRALILKTLRLVVVNYSERTFSDIPTRQCG